MRKTYKPLTKREIFIITVLVIVLIPIGLYGLLQTNLFQKFLTQKAASYLSDKLKTKITIGSLNFSLFDKVSIEKLYVEDLHHDTLIYIGNLKINIDEFSLSKNIIRLSKAELSNVKFYLKKDSLNVSNFQFVSDALSSKDTVKTVDTVGESLKISCRSFSLSNASFINRAYKPNEEKNSVNFKDLNLKKINVFARHFYLHKDSIKAFLDSISFIDKSGFVLNLLSGDAFVCDKTIDIFNLQIRTPRKTDLLLKHFKFAFDSMADLDYFEQKVRILGDFRSPSKFCFTDLSYFVETFKGFSQVVDITGKLEGRIDSLSGKKFKINFGSNTEFYSNFFIKGLPEINKTEFNIGIINLSTHRQDFEYLKDPNDSTKLLVNLPQALKELGRISYKGKIIGSATNFAAEGNLESNLGKISTLVNITNDTLKSETNIAGKIDGQNLEIGKLIGDEKNFGKLTFHQEVNVFFIKDSINGNLLGSIDSVFINQYKYQNIKINGLFTKKKFDGSIKIDDPNLVTSFAGNINFEQSIPKFKFDFILDKAMLYNLNLVKNDQQANLTFGLKVDFVGTNPDDVNGFIRLSRNLVYTTKNEQLIMKKFFISSSIESYFGGSKVEIFEINSDFFNFYMKGIINFSHLSTAFNNFLADYHPTLADINKEIIDKKKKPKKINYDQVNRFYFSLHLNNTKKLTQLFLPVLTFEDSTKINGEFNSLENSLSLNCISKQLTVAGLKFIDFDLSTDKANKAFEIRTKSKKLELSESAWLENFSIQTKSFNDNTHLWLFWDNNKKKQRYSGDILANLIFKKKDSDKKTIHFAFQNSKLRISDTLWTIPASNIVLDSSSINISKFYLKNNKQSIFVDGSVTENAKDSLFIKISKFNLYNLSPLLGDGMSIFGVLNGNTVLKNLYDKPIFLINDSILALKVNQIFLGDLFVKSKLKNDSSKILLNAFTFKGLNTLKKEFNLSGEYNHNNGDINITTDLYRFKLLLFEPYFSSIAEINRWADLSGRINLTGNTKRPLVDARLKITGATFLLKFTQTQFDLSDSLGITANNNLITIHRTKLYSDKGSGFAYLTGNIKHKDFTNLNLNLNISATNFQFINTSETDTSYFYGTAYASGDVQIKGRPENLVFDISAKTEKRTRFYIPLNFNTTVSDDNSFITFITKDSIAVEKPKEYKVDLSGIRLNFDLEVTPDAEVQLIMDKKTGDIIKARGDANLKLEITSLGKFNMYGDYNISKGDYLFTLKNLISKKFDIEPGGSIKWDGDPTEAVIDLKAIYSIKKVPIYDLILEEEYRESKIPVECHLMMSDKLLKPNIKFGLKLIGGEERIVSQVNNLDEDNLNKQVLSLLVMNRFQSLPGINPMNQTGNSSVIGSINPGELLTNQLNVWLAQVSTDVNMSVNYTSGDEQNKQAIEVALSKTFFDDRVIVYSNVGVGGGSNEQKNQNNANKNNPNNIVGDVEVEVKLNKKGTLRFKAYNRANNDMNYSEAPYTQGIGIFYRIDFNSFFKKKKKNNEKK